MEQISSKIYYDTATGVVLCITSEMQGTVKPTTKEHDMEIYEELKDKNMDEVDSIELEYGTLATTFNNAKSYQINLGTKKLEVTYYTQEELDAMHQELQETQALNDRVTDISQYLQNQTDLISDVENSIIQSELNKLLN